MDEKTLKRVTKYQKEKRASLNIPKRLHKALKIAAVRECRTIPGLIMSMLIRCKHEKKNLLTPKSDALNEVSVNQSKSVFTRD
jgi:hypothetical protein